MLSFNNIVPEPILFNPLKHHLGFISRYSVEREEDRNSRITEINRELKHIGRAVTDVYTGSKSIEKICRGVIGNIGDENISDKEKFAAWSGTGRNNFRIIFLDDDSQWTVKYHENTKRYVHIFPARSGCHTIRVKSNTLRSALLYLIYTGTDYISASGLNYPRSLAGLPPVRSTADAEAITSMIEVIRNYNPGK